MLECSPETNTKNYSKINISLDFRSLKYCPSMQSFLIFHFGQYAETINYLKFSETYHNIFAHLCQI